MGANCFGFIGWVMQLEQAEGQVLQLGQTWEVTAREIAYLESWHLGKYPLGNFQLGKIFWEST